MRVWCDIVRIESTIRTPLPRTGVARGTFEAVVRGFDGFWASYAASGDAEHAVSPGILRAFDANDITRELWNSSQYVSRDGAGMYAKFAAPTIANGHVYLPTFSNQVVVYGLR